MLTVTNMIDSCGFEGSGESYCSAYARTNEQQTVCYDANGQPKGAEVEEKTDTCPS